MKNGKITLSLLRRFFHVIYRSIAPMGDWWMACFFVLIRQNTDWKSTTNADRTMVFSQMQEQEQFTFVWWRALVSATKWNRTASHDLCLWQARLPNSCNYRTVLHCVCILEALISQSRARQINKIENLVYSPRETMKWKKRKREAILLLSFPSRDDWQRVNELRQKQKRQHIDWTNNRKVEIFGDESKDEMEITKINPFERRVRCQRVRGSDWKQIPKICTRCRLSQHAEWKMCQSLGIQKKCETV